jgi:phosphate:Na+ symporter
VVLAAIGGNADKKRVALGNFGFNLVGTVVFMFLLNPCSRLITQHMGIQSNIIALVMFQTIVNLAGIVVFLPFLKPLGNVLQKLFRKGDRKSIFISNKPIADPDLALELLRSEVLSVLQHVLIFARSLFGSRDPDLHTHYYQKEFDNLPLDKQYEHIKIQHGEVFDYYIRLQAGNLQTRETLLAERLTTAARNAVYAAKSFKDTMSDVEEFSESGKDKKFMLFAETQKQTVGFAAGMERMLFETSQNKAADLLSFYTDVQQHYSQNIRHIYTGIVTEGLQEIEVTSAINLNREITTAFKSLTMAAKDVLLDEKEAAAFEELPGFIR